MIIRLSIFTLYTHILGINGMVRHSFLCPNGTLFSQETLSCTAWHQVDCTTQGVEVLSGQWSLITTLTIASPLALPTKRRG